VLGVDERRDAALLLCVGRDGEGEGGLAAGFRAKDLDDAPARDALAAQGQVEGERAGTERYASSSIFMIAPLPNVFSICDSVRSSAFFFSLSMGGTAGAFLAGAGDSPPLGSTTLLSGLLSDVRAERDPLVSTSGMTPTFLCRAATAGTGAGHRAAVTGRALLGRRGSNPQHTLNGHDSGWRRRRTRGQRWQYTKTQTTVKGYVRGIFTKDRTAIGGTLCCQKKQRPPRGGRWTGGLTPA
jgi:hypothetical protein